MARKIQTIFRIIGVVCLLLLGIAAPARATAILPNSLSILSSKAFRNVLESNDFLVVFRYSIAYASSPNETATDLYIFSLLSTENTSEYGSVTPYAYTTKGYGQGLSAIYLSHLSWDDSYQIRIMGNPAAFSSANLSTPIQFFPISDYSLETTQPAIAGEVGQYLIEQMQQLEAPWGKSLVLPSSGGMILSTTGEIYLSSAITGVTTMAPQITAIQIVSSTPATIDYGNATAANLTGQYGGTWVRTALDSAGSLGTGLVVFVFFIAIVVQCQRKFQRTEPGLIAGSLMFIGATRLGLVPLAITLTVALLCGIYIGYILIFRNA